MATKTITVSVGLPMPDSAVVQERVREAIRKELVERGFAGDDLDTTCRIAEKFVPLLSAVVAQRTREFMIRSLLG